MKSKKKRVDLQQIMEEAKNSQAGKLRDALAQEQQQHDLTRQELEMTKQQLKFHTGQLQLHEKREKKRSDGLKKAQQARKKGAKK